MKKLVRLETSDGHYVATGEILPLLKLPPIVTLGARFFQRYEEDVYREAFHTAVLRTVPSPDEGEVALPQKERCPLDDGRMFNQLPELYRKVGDDRVCQYCGSIHLDDFLALLDRFVDPDLPFWYLEMNDRRDKIYLRRPGIKNAMEGAIKFKMAHLPCDRAEELWPKMAAALRAGEVKWRTVVFPGAEGDDRRRHERRWWQLT